jgi:hypothetical protein
VEARREAYVLQQHERLLRQRPGQDVLAGSISGQQRFEIKLATIDLAEVFQMKIASLLLAICLIAISIPVLAHHGTGIAYDQNKPTVIKGTVTEFSWTNPHAHLLLDVKDAAGKVSQYAVEMNSPGVMLRQGWTKRQFKVGDEVSITVYPAKVGTPIGSCIGTCKVTINGKDNTPRTEVRDGL